VRIGACPPPSKHMSSWTRKQRGALTTSAAPHMLVTHRGRYDDGLNRWLTRPAPHFAKPKVGKLASDGRPDVVWRRGKSCTQQQTLCAVRLHAKHTQLLGGVIAQGLQPAHKQTGSMPTTASEKDVCGAPCDTIFSCTNAPPSRCAGLHPSTHAPRTASCVAHLQVRTTPEPPASRE